MKLKWGCPKCGTRGEVTLPEGIRPDQSARINVPAAHRKASPDCPIEDPGIGDEAYENAAGTAASARLQHSGRTPRGTRGN